MPNVYYLDYATGDDTYAGDSFAAGHPWKTITAGPTAARIAPGDVIRIAKSPDPTSLGSATWYAGPIPAAVAITSSTNAVPIVVTKNTHGLANGDIVQITGHTTNYSANGVWIIQNVATNTFELIGSVGTGTGGATGTYQKINSKCVKLDTACTKNIDYGFDLWTGHDPSNVVASHDSTYYKQGGTATLRGASVKLAIASGFTTGLAGFKAISPGSLTAYSQISFWMQLRTLTSLAINTVRVCLCSDSSGADVVDAFTVAFAIPTNGNNVWMPFTIAKDGGGTLGGTAIASIAIYIDADPGAVAYDLYFNNFIAVQAASEDDSLSLTSLIGHNTADNPSWFGIQSIGTQDGVQTVIVLDNDVNTTALTGRGVMTSGVGSVTTYKRETIKTTMGTGTAGVALIQDSGTAPTTGAPSYIEFQGGYNTSSDSVDGLTFLDGRNGLGSGIHMNSKSWIKINKIYCHRYSYGLQIPTSYGIYIDEYGAGNCTTYGMAVVSSNACIFNNIVYCNNNTIAGIYNQYSSNLWNSIKRINNNTGPGIRMDNSFDNEINAIVSCKNNSTFGINSTYSYNNVIRKMVTASNVTAAFNLDWGSLFLFEPTISEATVLGAGPVAGSKARVHYVNSDGTTWQWCEGGNISGQTTTRHTASGIAWKLSPTNALRNTNYPLTLPIAQVAVAASALVTVSAYMLRSNSGLTLRLICPASQLTGLTEQYVDSDDDTVNWVQKSITFTPSEAGVVQIEVHAYGGTTYSGYIDDLTISQA
jgi:hypothetical protein